MTHYIFYGISLGIASALIYLGYKETIIRSSKILQDIFRYVIVPNYFVVSVVTSVVFLVPRSPTILYSIQALSFKIFVTSFIVYTFYLIPKILLQYVQTKKRLSNNH